MLLLYFMDGLKYEMMKKHMPTLAAMDSRPLKSDFGYSCACHATMYTGKNVDEHNTWFIWKKGDNSPYRFIDKIPLLKYFNWIPVKVVLSKVARKFNKNTSFAGIPMLVNLPLKYWSQFELTENNFWTEDNYKPEYKTIFKILRDKNVPHQLVGLSKGGDVFEEEKKVDYSANEFIYYFIGDVDSYMHKYGENAAESINYLKNTDDFIKMTMEKARATGKDVTVVCYSDHGHIDVDKKIDVNDYFKPHGLNVNNYLHLTESTFIRFWFNNDTERREVEQVLADMQQQNVGFVIDDKMKDTYHLNFDSNENGDIVFHLNAPNIFTNTIWGFGKTIKSAHGYYPELEKHYGVFASDKKLVKKDFAYLTDVLPTVLDVLEIDSTPYELGGDDFIEHGEGK